MNTRSRHLHAICRFLSRARHRLASRSNQFLAFGLLLLLAEHAAAQVPPGCGVYCKLNYFPIFNTNVGGVTIFNPLNGISPCNTKTPFTPVTNMPADLVSASGIGGSDSVLVRDSDGTVVVGEFGIAKTIGIYHLTLNGAAVQSYSMHSLGTASGLAEVHQMAWVDDSKVAFSHAGVPGPSGTALPAQGIAILDLGTGAITPVPVTFPSGIGSINALALNRSRTTAYIAFYYPHEVYSVPFPAGGTATKVGPTLPDGPYQLDVDHLGTVHVSTFNQGLFALSGGVWKNLDTTRQLNAMTIDRVSGDVLFTAVPVPDPAALYRWSASGGRKTLPGMAAKDAVAGIAVRSSMIPYGSQSGGAAPYTWQIAPNPGGIPMVGNEKFSLSVATTADPSESLIGFSMKLASAPVPFQEATILLQTPILPTPWAAVAPRNGGGNLTDLGMIPLVKNGSTYSLVLPIPNTTALCGLRVYAQTIHRDSTGYVSTPALCIDIQ